MGDIWDAWWQQTYHVKSIVLGNVRMLGTNNNNNNNLFIYIAPIP